MATFEYRCTDCGRTYSRDEVRYLCPACGPAYRPGIPLLGVLEAVFDYGAIASAFDRQRPDWNLFCPVEPEFHPPFPVGNTPLARVDRLGSELGLERLWVKNDGLNPSGSLKDRASFLVAAEAKRLGIDLIVAASTGNAASALAAVCASSGQQALIFVPQTAPKAKLVQMVLYGAKVVPVKGTYDDAFRLSLDYTAQRGGLNRNTAYHPLTIEGKKTAALEIWAQLGGTAPDAVLVSVGDGVILGGLHKGFVDLKRAGLIKRLPQLIGCRRRAPMPSTATCRPDTTRTPSTRSPGPIPSRSPAPATPMAPAGRSWRARASPSPSPTSRSFPPRPSWRRAPASSPSRPAPPPWPA
jgi:threonine synthase